MNARLKNQRFFLWLNKLVFPLLYLGHWHQETTLIETAAGGKFHVRVNSSDILLVWEIWKKKIYQDPRIPIHPDGIVVDIGAHIGVFAVWAARLANRGRVYAYEAAADNYRLLEENRRLNGLDNLVAHNLAVFDKAGEYDFYLPGKNGALGSLMQDQNSTHERVHAVTLDDLVQNAGLNRIDLLKMDIEGAEYPVLLNTAPETLARVRCLVLEYHDFEASHWRPAMLAEHLQAHGFETAVEDGIFPQKLLFGTGIIKAWRS